MSKWPDVPLRDISEFERATVQPESIQDGTLYVGLENIVPGGRFVGVRPVEPGDLQSTKFSFTPNHVLYGKLRPYLCKVAVPAFSGVCSTDVIPIRPGAMLDRRYLAHYLRQPSVVALATARASGVNLPRISPQVLAGFEIPLPPLPEQKRIAAILDAAEALREKRRRWSEIAESLVPATFAQMFGRALSLDWPVVPLEEVVDHVTVGHVGPTSEHFRDSGIPFLRTGNIGTLEINLSDLKFITPEFHKKLKKSTLKAGDVLVSRVISTDVRCAVVPPALEGANCANVIVIRPGKNLSSSYLATFIRSRRTQSALLRREVGSAQSVVNTRVIQQLAIPVPPQQLQDRFSELCREFEKLSKHGDNAQTQLDQLAAVAQSRAFKGNG